VKLKSLWWHLFFGPRHTSGAQAPDVTNPTITSANTVNNPENTQLAHTLTADEPVTWTIIGGSDQAHFGITGFNTLRWAAGGTKNFESPGDTGVDNTYIVQVRATDGAALTADQTITVTVTAVNEAPTVANAISDTGAQAGTPFAKVFPANTFADVDVGDTGTYTATKSDNSALPAWLTFTAATRAFSGTPTSGDTGILSVKVTVTDSGGLSVSDTFDITVVADTGGVVLDPAPDAPTLTLTSGATDNQPDFLVEGDLEVDDVVTITAFDDAGLTSVIDTGQGTVTVGGTLTVTNQLGPLSDDTYWFTAVTERAGASDSDASNTETITIDTAAPTISGALSPADGATGVAVNANCVITFNETVIAGAAASFRLYETTGDVLVEELDETDFGTKVTISGAAVTINWTADLDNSLDYYIQIDADSVTDVVGNGFAGIANETTWNFTSVAGGSWDPTDVSAAFWYDGSDTGSVAGPDPLTQWSDKSGNARHITPVAAHTNTSLQTNIQNSLSAVLFEGNANELVSSSFTLAQSFSFFAVVRLVGVPPIYSTLLDEVGHAGGRPIVFIKHTDSSNRAIMYAGSVIELAASPLSAATTYLLHGLFAGAASAGGVDGTQVATADAGSAGFDNGIAIGGTNSDNTHLDCYVCEMFAYPGVSTTDRDDAIAYLEAKWGL
jgi:hypothetical protein